jgi:predicted transposase/invertase (TIGR01784 family)
MMRPLVSFDWAIKRLLRQKANFGILEGFLTVLLKEDIKIQSIGESESNAQSRESKINKVDILCETTDKKVVLIELQYNSENDYFHRMYFGTSKAIIDRMTEGYTYDKIAKVISINIVYFDLGQGEDYVYYGSTEFRGIHHNDTLRLSGHQSKLYHMESPKEVFAEYYIIKVNKFNDVAKDSLDEWIYYFKNNKLPTTYTAPGLDSVSSKLKYDDMSPQSKIDYDAHQKEMAITYGVIETAKFEGREEGRQEGRQEGEAIGAAQKTKEVVINSYRKGIATSIIAAITELSENEVIQILKQEGLVD